MDHKRITLFAGHYGSGKTNIAVNYALLLAREGLRTAIADLDIVNPYFRTKDSARELEAAGVEPELRFDREDMTVWASPEALGRVYRNLIANALRHGGGGLTVSGRDGVICFSNQLPPGSRPDPEHLFDRFYQSSPARAKGGAGLGLSIVRELMEQIWINLIGNAVKFTPEDGRILIQARTDGERIRVEIKDSGIGMDEDTITHIFEKYYQNDTLNAVRGNGIGLSIVYRIVTLCGGQIFVRSAVNEGSTFTVILPRI